MALESFVGAGKRLESIDIPRIAAEIGVSEADVETVMEVEARGSGFDRQGRPKMLFEPHVFYRNLSGAKRQEAVDAGLAYRKWGTKPYPKDSYPRLLKAMKIDGPAALMSASWGASQILGENYKMVGYPTVEAMVQAFMDDEDDHIEAMAQYIVAAGLDDDLREHRWAPFARGYNGPGYAKNGYDTKLAAAYKRFSGGRDALATGEPSRYPVVQMGAQSFIVEHLQRELKELRYEPGKVDGHFGAATRAAVLAFQADHGLDTDGVVGEKTWTVLETSARPKPISEERAEATVKTLREEGSSTIRNGDIAQTIGGVVAGLGGLGGVTAALEKINATTGELNKVVAILEPMIETAGDNWWIILTAGAVVVIGFIQRMKKARVEDHRSGANMAR